MMLPLNYIFINSFKNYNPHFIRRHLFYELFYEPFYLSNRFSMNFLGHFVGHACFPLNIYRELNLHPIQWFYSLFKIRLCYTENAKLKKNHYG
jgi:hypothetical protein